MSCKHLAWILGVLLVGGCQSSPSARDQVDALVCGRANRPMDPEPPAVLGQPIFGSSLSTTTPALTSLLGLPRSATPDEAIRLAAAQEVPGRPGGKEEETDPLIARLKVPPELPGASKLQEIEVGSVKNHPQAAIEQVVRKYFPPLPPLPALENMATPQPGERLLTLADLEKLAMTTSPLIRQAASDVAGAQWAAIQAGAYPNPTVGFTSQTQGPGGGPNYGALLSQTIKTAGKLKTAQAAALMDLENSKLAYRKAETDLTSAVRSGYFAVLVAQESVKANRALVQLTDEVYKVMVDELKLGLVATYEPMQVAVFASQTRVGLIQARNSYTLAWKQLAATLGLPALPPAALAGRFDMPIPVYHYDRVLAHVLSRHTDVLTAANGIEKARYNLRSAELTPIPDVNFQASLIEDVTPAGPSRLVVIGQASVALPLWDRNRGAIYQARAALLRANEEPHRVRDDLSARVADAFRRYDESRDVLAHYRMAILPKQVQAFRAAVVRHAQAQPGSVAFADLITAEQNLVSVIGPYLVALGQFWQAVTDVANLLQTDDLYQLADGQDAGCSIADLEQLLKLPCCHPCNPLPNPALRGANPTWPAAGMPTSEALPAPMPGDTDKAPAALKIEDRGLRVADRQGPPATLNPRSPVPFGPPTLGPALYLPNHSN